jgi:Uma2 family endonuclease
MAAVPQSLPLRHWTRSEYERLAKDGYFRGERVELVYGAVVRMSPIGNPHNFAVEQLNLLLVPIALAGRARVRIQSTYLADDDSLPEPDVLISEPGEPLDDHPTQALLVAEVSDTSLDYDRTVKRKLYAEANTPEYWLVNLEERCVEVFRDPVDGAYAAHAVVGEEGTVSPSAFPDIVVPVARLFLPKR